MTWRVLWPLALLVFALSSERALAQVQGQDPPGYADAVRRGLAELDTGNYPEAREEFMQAHKLYPNARTLRGLGMVEFEQRNYQESVRLLQEALASDVKPLSGRLRDEADALLGRAKRYLGELSLQVVPEAAAVRVDGKPVARPKRKALLLEVGEHRLERVVVVHVAGPCLSSIPRRSRSCSTKRWRARAAIARALRRPTSKSWRRPRST